MHEGDPVLARIDDRSEQRRRHDQPRDHHGRILAVGEFGDDAVLGVILSLDPSLRQLDTDLSQTIERLRSRAVLDPDLCGSRLCASRCRGPARHSHRRSTTGEEVAKRRAFGNTSVFLFGEARREVDPALAITAPFKALHRGDNTLVLVSMEPDVGDGDGHRPTLPATIAIMDAAPLPGATGWSKPCGTVTSAGLLP